MVGDAGADDSSADKDGVRGVHVYCSFCDYSCCDTPQEVSAARATLNNTTAANHPKTTAYAVPRLTLLMQVMPMAVRIKLQMPSASNGVSRARSTGEPSGPMKYPRLVATGFSMLNPSLLTPAKSDAIASSGI